MEGSKTSDAETKECPTEKFENEASEEDERRRRRGWIATMVVICLVLGLASSTGIFFGVKNGLSKNSSELVDPNPLAVDTSKQEKTTLLKKPLFKKVKKGQQKKNKPRKQKNETVTEIITTKNVTVTEVGTNTNSTASSQVKTTNKLNSTVSSTKIESKTITTKKPGKSFFLDVSLEITFRNYKNHFTFNFFFPNYFTSYNRNNYY